MSARLASGLLDGPLTQQDEENAMGARSEVLARQFEAKIRDALATLDTPTDHYASALEPIAQMIEMVVRGRRGHLTGRCSMR